MIAEIADWVGTALPILLLFPLVWLVGGFLLESIDPRDPRDEPPRTAANALGDAAAWLFVMGLCSYMVVGEWQAQDRSWFWLGLLSLALIEALFKLVSLLREARRLAAQGAPEPRM
ncbi:hypothetical protein [Erythrobacter donghaensis]|uniref:hypothetical protein n=1 Tax=Erythrobacter donghaensis TaxID=267135 RepID=UPI000A36F6F8|nr:hypothetical protein [Erythrobacter donghaensis]